MVLVEVLEKVYPCNYTLGEEMLLLSQHSFQGRKKVTEGLQRTLWGRTEPNTATVT